MIRLSLASLRLLDVNASMSPLLASLESMKSLRVISMRREIRRMRLRRMLLRMLRL